MMTAVLIATLIKVESYGKYTNSRFAFRTLYPKSWTKQQPPENHSGRTWLAKGFKGRFSVGGSWRMDDNTLTSLYKNDLENYREQGYKISYTTKKGDWYVISGSNKTKQFYRREWVRVHTVKGMTIEYPASLGKKLDGMVAKLSKGFEIGPDAEEW